MAWTYGSNPVSDKKDAVRLLIGDTNADEPGLQDEEIQWFISQHGSEYYAASGACLALAAKFSSKASDRQVGPLRINAAEVPRAYRDLSKRLRIEGDQRGLFTAPFAGGITVADKESDAKDDTLVQPRFRRQQFDNDRVGDYDDYSRDRDR